MVEGLMQNIGSIIFIMIISLLALICSVTMCILNAHGLFKKIKSINKKILIASFLILFSSVYIYRLCIVEPLNQAEHILSRADVRVYIDGNEKNIREELLESFSKRVYLKSSGSRPIEYFSLKMEVENSILEFRLGRDSRDEKLYWVYFPKYNNSASLCYIKIHDLIW